MNAFIIFGENLRSYSRLEQMYKFISFLILLLIFSIGFQIKAQETPKQTRPTKTETVQEKPVASPAFDVKRTAAYADLLLRKIEAAADLQVLLAEYNEDAREVREKQLTVKMFESALKSLESIPAERLSKLTLASARLLARKLEAEAELKILSEIYTEEHPRLKEAKIRLTVFDGEYKKMIQ